MTGFVKKRRVEKEIAAKILKEFNRVFLLKNRSPSNSEKTVKIYKRLRAQKYECWDPIEETYLRQGAKNYPIFQI